MPPRQAEQCIQMPLTSRPCLLDCESTVGLLAGCDEGVRQALRCKQPPGPAVAGLVPSRLPTSLCGPRQLTARWSSQMESAPTCSDEKAPWHLNLMFCSFTSKSAGPLRPRCPPQARPGQRAQPGSKGTRHLALCLSSVQWSQSCLLLLEGHGVGPGGLPYVALLGC